MKNDCLLHIHKKIAASCRGFGLFGLTLTYCFAVATSLISVLPFRYMGWRGHNRHSFASLQGSFMSKLINIYTSKES